MPRKVNDACMFCTEELPCQSHAPKVARFSEKKPKRSVKDTSLPSASVSPSRAELPVAPPVDVKAAMKAAVRQDTVVHTRLEREQSFLKTDDETISCLNVLYPLLHPDEVSKYDLDSHIHRVTRWRIRHG